MSVGGKDQGFMARGCKLPHLSLLIILCHFSWLQWNITTVTHPFALSTRTLSLCCPILLVPLHPTIPIVWHFPKEMKHLSLCPFTLPPRDPNSFSEVPQHLFQPGLHSIIRMTPLLLWRHVYTRWHFAQHLHSTTAISNISLHDILTLLPLSTLVLYPFHCYRSRIQIGQHFVVHIGGLQPNSRILTFPSSGNLHTCTFCPPSLSLGNESDVLR